MFILREVLNLQYSAFYLFFLFDYSASFWILKLHILNLVVLILNIQIWFLVYSLSGRTSSLSYYFRNIFAITKSVLLINTKSIVFIGSRRWSNYFRFRSNIIQFLKVITLIDIQGTNFHFFFRYPHFLFVFLNYIIIRFLKLLINVQTIIMRRNNVFRLRRFSFLIFLLLEVIVIQKIISLFENYRFLSINAR